jgi:YVTN family beta-propeller protein
LSVVNGAGVKQMTVNTLRLPTGIAMDSTAGRAYVTDTESNSVTVVATATLAMAGTFPLGARPLGIAWGGNALYSANDITDSIMVSSPAGRSPASWTSGPGTWAVAVDPKLQQAYAVNSGDGSVSIFSLKDGSVKATLNVGATGPAAVASQLHEWSGLCDERDREWYGIGDQWSEQPGFRHRFRIGDTRLAWQSTSWPTGFM